MFYHTETKRTPGSPTPQLPVFGLGVDPSTKARGDLASVSAVGLEGPGKRLLARTRRRTAAPNGAYLETFSLKTWTQGQPLSLSRGANRCLLGNC